MLSENEIKYFGAKIKKLYKKFCSALLYTFISIHVGYVHKPYPILYESLRVEEIKQEKYVGKIEGK